MLPLLFPPLSFILLLSLIFLLHLFLSSILFFFFSCLSHPSLSPSIFSPLIRPFSSPLFSIPFTHTFFYHSFIVIPETFTHPFFSLISLSFIIRKRKERKTERKEREWNEKMVKRLLSLSRVRELVKNEQDYIGRKKEKEREGER